MPTLSEVLLANMYETELDILRKAELDAIAAMQRWMEQARTYRQALESIADLVDEDSDIMCIIRDTLSAA